MKGRVMTALLLIVITGWPDLVRVQDAVRPGVWIDYAVGAAGVRPVGWSCAEGWDLRECGADTLALMSA